MLHGTDKLTGNVVRWPLCGWHPKLASSLLTCSQTGENKGTHQVTQKWQIPFSTFPYPSFSFISYLEGQWALTSSRSSRVSPFKK